jgi:hypothetical protein
MMHTADLEFENRLIQVYGQWVSVSIMSALPRTSLKVTAWSLWLMNTWHYRVSALIDDPQGAPPSGFSSFWHHTNILGYM